MDSSAPTLGDFSARVGRDFAIATDAGSVSLALEAAEPLGAGERHGGAFELLFRGPREPVLEQAVHRMEEGGDSFEIFIVPIAQDDAGTRYQAIFN